MCDKYLNNHNLLIHLPSKNAAPSTLLISQKLSTIFFYLKQSSYFSLCKYFMHTSHFMPKAEKMCIYDIKLANQVWWHTHLWPQHLRGCRGGKLALRQPDLHSELLTNLDYATIEPVSKKTKGIGIELRLI